MSTFQRSPKLKRIIYKILPFGLFWSAFGIIYSLVERGLLGTLEYYPSTGNTYEFSYSITITPIASGIMGLILGTVEILFLDSFFKKKSFGFKIIIKTCLYLLSICLFLITLTFITNALRLGLPISDLVVIESVFKFFNNFAFWSVIIYMGAIINITLFVSEVSDNLGQGVLINFLTGKYHNAREEKRIFMFLDMKSSTSIAEKLGHVKYYQLLNKYYKDLTEAIIQTSGEIYQYVGDEVVVSWKFNQGLKNSNCLYCFFIAKDIIKSSYREYNENFGLVPGFKAGLHYGIVTTGEIGIIKKEIIFTGDVLNTTSRIQSNCNNYDVDILISDDLLAKLNLNREYDTMNIGECELKGRDEKVKLSTVSKIKSFNSQN